MDPVSVPGRDDDQRIIGEMIGRYDAPSFIRRAKRVENTYQLMISDLERRRSEMLAFVRLRLGQVRALAGDWDRLTELLTDRDDLGYLQQLHDELNPELRVPLTPTRSPGPLRAALTELVEALVIFNGRWQKVLDQVDLTRVNAEREGYNRYYLLERECALGSARSARASFQPLQPIDKAEIAAQFPLLRLPRLEA
jgi:hypothetical protein